MNRAPLPDRALATLILTLALAAFPLGALASHDFTDVPDSNLFHADISALAASGVTSGCGGGNYCPSAFVTREQMAAFMNRLGALAAGKTPVVNAAELSGLTSGQFLRSDVANTGLFNCPGATLQPITDGLDYTIYFNALRVESGTGYFSCAVLLPDGATVIALRAGIYDLLTTAYADCGLLRAPLFTRTDTTQMAYVFSGLEDALGNVLPADLTIFPGTEVIDNDAYSYVARCWFSTGSPDLTINAVSVEYTVEGLPLP